MGTKNTPEMELTEVVKETTKMTFRVDKTLKQQAEQVFSTMGMTMSGAINIFLSQVVREQRLPFHPGATPEEMNETGFEGMLDEADEVLTGEMKAQRKVRLEEIWKEM